MSDRQPNELDAPTIGVASLPERPARFYVTGAGIPDTSFSGAVMLQQPVRWTHDFDPDSGNSRASLIAEVPIFASPPAAVTPPPGTSDTTLATTEFVSEAMAQAVLEAVIKARIGSDGRFPAAPGDIGELLQVTTPQPGIELTASTITMVASLELTAGDWDVEAMGGFGYTGIPLPPNVPNIDFVSAINTTVGFPGWPNAGGTNAMAAQPGSIGNLNLAVFQRVLTGVPQTVFLLGYAAGFTGPVRIYGFGYMQAKRRR